MRTWRTCSEVDGTSVLVRQRAVDNRRRHRTRHSAAEQHRRVTQDDSTRDCD